MTHTQKLTHTPRRPGQIENKGSHDSQTLARSTGLRHHHNNWLRQSLVLPNAPQGQSSHLTKQHQHRKTRTLRGWMALWPVLPHSGHPCSETLFQEESATISICPNELMEKEFTQWEKCDPRATIVRSAMSACGRACSSWSSTRLVFPMTSPQKHGWRSPCPGCLSHPHSTAICVSQHTHTDTNTTHTQVSMFPGTQSRQKTAARIMTDFTNSSGECAHSTWVEMTHPNSCSGAEWLL